MSVTVEKVFSVFLASCFAFGLVIGCMGLGAGLVFLSPTQSVGVGILSFGCGSFLGGALGGRGILKAIIKTAVEMDKEASK